MNRSELPLVTLDGRHTGALLAHPCPSRPGWDRPVTIPLTPH